MAKQKKLIERAYTEGERCGLTVWGQDEAGPFQTVPYAGESWAPEGQPVRQSHEYHRNGTAKMLTLFHPADGQVRVKGVTSATNAVLHPWLKEELSAVLATLPKAADEQVCAAKRAEWLVWQEGLTQPITLPQELPPLRMLLIWDNLAGHTTPEMVLWLFSHGIHAAVYAAERVVAEYDGVGAADLETAGVGGSARTDGRGNHHLAGSDSTRMESESNALHLGRKAGIAAGATASTGACSGRFGRVCSSAGAATPPQRVWLTAIQLSTVHKQWTCWRW